MQIVLWRAKSAFVYSYFRLLYNLLHTAPFRKVDTERLRDRLRL